MTQQSLKVVPFGKYKGQPVEVLQQDHDYTQWLMAQPWLRERFQPMYNLIVNNFGAPSETPEHNALQALFLEEDRQQAFLRTVGATKKLEDTVIRRVRADRRQKVEAFDDTSRAIARYAKDIECYTQELEQPEQADAILVDLRRRQAPFEITQRKKAIEEQRAERAELLDLIAKLDAWLATPEFDGAIGFTFEEDGVDVTLSVTRWMKVSGLTGGENHDASWRRNIEVKPTVADEYPAILRQMRASGSTFLLLEEYQGQGVSVEQFKQIFKASSITVVFRAEVDAELARQKPLA